MNRKYILITRAGLLLALTLVFQSLRFIIPIPPFLSVFLIGSLVNTCLLVAEETVGMKYALIIACSAPIVAYFQQLLPLPIFIIPVVLGNVIYILVFSIGIKYKMWLGICAAAISKSVFMYAAFVWLFTMIAIPGQMSASLLFIMSWPQLITGVIGGIVSRVIKRKLQLLSF